MSLSAMDVPLPESPQSGGMDLLETTLPPPPLAEADVDRLSTLPTPCLQLIGHHLSYMRHPHRLAAFSLVCKSIRDSILPDLWRVVRWDLSHFNWRSIFAKGDSHALRYVEDMTAIGPSGELEISTDWLIFAKCPNLKVLKLYQQHDSVSSALHRRSLRRSLLLPPSTIVFPNLHTLILESLRPDHYLPTPSSENASPPGWQRRDTPYAQINPSISFPVIKDVALHLPQATVTHMATILDKVQGFPTMENLIITVKQGSYGEPISLSGLGRNLKSLTMGFHQWWTQDLLVLPNIGSLPNLVGLNIMIAPDELKGHVKDIFQRRLPSYLPSFRPVNFIRWQDDAGEYEPGKSGAVTMTSIAGLMDEMTAGLPDFTTLSICRLKKHGMPWSIYWAKEVEIEIKVGWQVEHGRKVGKAGVWENDKEVVTRRW